jgi:hypothetical protein
MTRQTEEAPCDVESPELRYPADERPGDPALLRLGWQRRFMADASRLQEYIDLYGTLNFDVRTEPVNLAELGEECEDCRLMICRLFVTVYTRRKEPSADEAAVGLEAVRRKD